MSEEMMKYMEEMGQENLVTVGGSYSGYEVCKYSVDELLGDTPIQIHTA